ncbi:NTP transferase domain-containing protein [Oceanidesulfovibrio marinus]|nr:NTP transferase domain-containing protein [Oceanidesulfovibrio marinus]
MHIVIPMSGRGQRFLDAGYTDPKPLIAVDGKPIIEHVVNLFPGEDKMTFICSQDHLQSTRMRSELERIKPGANIIGIAPHKKGPVYAVSQAYDLLEDEEEVIVNYCDFAVYWDYKDFLHHTRSRKAGGAVPAYKGFHPHMLGTTNYAFLRDDRQWMLEIQEKKPFTDDRMQEFASSGTYYFRTGAMVKRYFDELMHRDVNLNGEYYVSMVYNLLVEANIPVSIYNVQHMLQWGTPSDLEEYQGWSDLFADLPNYQPGPETEPGSMNLIPLAGLGSRFSREGYETPKPLIPVSGRPMVVQAAASLPPAERHTFVCRSEHLAEHPLDQALRGAFPDTRIVSLDEVTEGQAITCRLGLREEDFDAPLLIGACDNGMLIDAEAYAVLRADAKVDAIAFSFRGNPTSDRNPHMYGWLDVDADETVLRVSVKEPISDTPLKDHAIVGAFYFRTAGIFLEGLDKLVADNVRINNEFYVDSILQMLVDLDHTVKVFEIDHYVCWGTPDDLRTYEYWQSFFHKCPWHGYTLDKDPFMEQGAIQEYDDRYRGFKQSWE